MSPTSTRLARRLGDHLSHCGEGWPTRFAVLDGLPGAVADTDTDRAIPVPAAAAWESLVRTGGALPIGELASQVGWSRRHLAEQFRRAFGVGPKELATVLRFERAQRMLRTTAHPSLAIVAAECGYADQSHLTRDWHRFAGASPSAWLSDELPFVQDDEPAAGR